MATQDIHELYAETADVLTKEHAATVTDIKQGVIALQAAIASRTGAEKRASLLARLFNRNA